MPRERWASFISGGGTTMEQMVLATQSGEIKLDAGLVIASTPGAGGIAKAERLGVPWTMIDPNDYKVNGHYFRDKFGLALLRVLKDYEITVVTQNGWMPRTPKNVIDAYSGRIFNQHPGPVPEFGGGGEYGMYGKRVHDAVLEYRKLTRGFEPVDNYWTEVVAQRVDPVVDMGAVVKSERVKILEGDTPEQLQERALPVEHRLQIELLKDIVAGTVKELPPREPIVLPGQEATLAFVKKLAAEHYPHG